MSRACRVVPAFILATVFIALVAAPAEAKGAFGLAGRMVTGAYQSGYGSTESFEWYEFFGEHTVAATDRVVILFAIVPFGGASTTVGLDAIGGTTFLNLVFGGGTVSDLPYARTNWSVVQATLDFSAQRYEILVNDESAGPFPFTESSNSIQAFRINAGFAGSRSIGWIDSVWLLHESGVEESLLLDVTFDDGRAFDLAQGTLTAEMPLFSGSATAIGFDVYYVVGGAVAAVVVVAVVFLRRRRR